VSAVCAAVDVFPVAYELGDQCDLPFTHHRLASPFPSHVLAASSPTIVLLMVRSLSSPATAPRTWNTSSPPSVVVFMLSLRKTNSTARLRSPFTRTMSLRSERPNLSSFHASSA
jgi:hypothetical protein